MPWRPSEPGEVPTLGWVALDWISEYLAAPDRVEYEPFVPTREQAEFILRFYAINHVTGHRRVRRGLLSRPRGWGKSPLLAALACLEALGPVVPDGWDADGQPVGKPWSEVRTPLVQLAAVSERQTQNSWTPLLEMLREGPACDEFPGLEPLDSFVNLPRGRIEPVTSSPASIKGNRAVFAILDQALELGTMIPTPRGWSTMGDLQVGDEVFGSDGRPARVIQAKPVSTEHDCFRVTFMDGTSVVASDGHLWMTKLAASGAAPKIRTTGEMYRDGQSGHHAVSKARRQVVEAALISDPTMSNAAIAAEFGANVKTVAAARKRLITLGSISETERRGGGPAKLTRYRPPVAVEGDGAARRFMIPVAPARHLPETNLAVPPYLLGYWLGDGTRGKCELSVHAEDLADVQRALLEVGVDSWPRRYAPTGKGYSGENSDQINLTFSRRAGYQGSARPEVAKALAAPPCYRDKHVPEEYFSSSIEQRTALLQGLMDSDGHCTKAGTCTFVATVECLAVAVTRLLRSLGQVTSGPKWVEDDRYAGGGKYRVDFTPRAGLVPFKLGRKASRVRGHNRGAEWIAIKSIQPIERVPVRCIEVDTEDHLFAFGEGGHLTHNTEEWTKSNGGLKLAQTMRINAGKIGGSTVESPNAFVPGFGSVAENSAEYARQIVEGKAKDDGLLYDHREAPPETDPYDRESLMVGLRYAYGDSSDHPDGCMIHTPPCPPGWASMDRRIGEFWDPSNDPQVLRADMLNQITHASDAWLTQPEWAACADATKLLADDDVVTLGFDGSKSRKRGVADATALVATRVSDGHMELVHAWEQPDGPAGEGWEVPANEVDAVVDEAFRRWTVVAFYADPAKWESYVAKWEARHGVHLLVKASPRHPIEWWINQGRALTVVKAIEAMQTAILERGMTHDGGSVLTRHFLNARRDPTRSGLWIRKDHPDSSRKIDAAWAGVASWQARLDALAAGVGRASEEFALGRIR